MHRPGLFPIIFIFLTCLSISPNLRADEKSPWYFTADAGVAIQQDTHWQGRTFNGDLVSPPAKFHPGYRVDFAVGRQFTNGLSLEFETGVIANSLSDPSETFFFTTTMDFYQVPFLFNAIYTFDQWKCLRPYLGVGAGPSFAAVDLTAVGIDHTVRYDTSLALQALAGVQYRIRPNLDLDLSYKCFYAQEYTFFPNDDGRMANLVNHQFALGLNFHF